MVTKTDFFRQNGKSFFFEDPFKVAEYIRENAMEDAEKVIALANDIVRRKFMFVLRWDMERTNEPVVFQDEIDWLHMPGDDPEWIYAFNRMRFWICLGQAYALTGDEKYAEAFVSQLRHWIKNVKQNDPKCEKAWRSIEVGLRLEYWLKSMRYFEASQAVTSEVVEEFIKSAEEHAECIMGIWNSYNLMSNWGVLANHGLFMAGVMLPETSRTNEYLKEALRRLEMEIRMQVYRDGTHWEQSPMYHNEVLHCYLDVVLLAQRCRIPLPETILRKTKDMCLLDLYAAKPDHNEISMGDSDEIDQRDLITRSAVIFQDGLLKSGGYELPDFDTAWELGEEGISCYAALLSNLPTETDRGFSDSGNFYFRSNWREDATFLHFHCGTLGAGHGHADQLHFDLFSRGEDVLMDSGRFSYVFGDKRTQYKRLSAHNTVMVDGKELYICTDSWECGDLTRAVNQKFHSASRYGYTEGGHLAYMELENGGVFVNRRIIFLKPDIVVVADEFYTAGQHTYNQFFHFNNAGKLCGGGSRYTYVSGKLRVEMEMLAPGLASYVREADISRHYNQSEQAACLTTEFMGSGFTCAFTVIALSDPDEAGSLEIKKMPVRSNFKGIIFEDKQVECLDIRRGDTHYTLVVAHEEFASPTDTFLADGCTGFGSAVVFDRTAGETEIGTVLLW